MKELRLLKNEPMKLYYDNKATFDIAYNPIQHDRMEHIDIDIS